MRMFEKAIPILAKTEFKFLKLALTIKMLETLKSFWKSEGSYKFAWDLTTIQLAFMLLLGKITKVNKA